MKNNGRYPHLRKKSHYTDKHVSFADYTEEEIDIIRENIKELPYDKRFKYINDVAKKFIKEYKSINRRINYRKTRKKPIDDSLLAQKGYCEGVMSYLYNQYDLYDSENKDNTTEQCKHNKEGKSSVEFDMSFLKELSNVIEIKDKKVNILVGYSIIDFYRDFFIRNNKNELSEKLSPEQIRKYFLNSVLFQNKPMKTKTISNYKAELIKDKSPTDNILSDNITRIDKKARIKLYKFIISCNNK